MNIIRKIFLYAHSRGSHGLYSIKWKRVEDRLRKHYAPCLFTMVRRGIKKERF